MSSGSGAGGSPPPGDTPPPGGTPPPGSPPGPTPPPGGPRRPPPGLRDQLGSTFDAAKALVVAHVELGRAEAGQIAGEAGRVAAAAGIAIGSAIFAVFLLVIGTMMWFGEWILGSIGWGVLHGVLLLISVGVVAVLAALGVAARRIVGALVVGIIVGVIVGLIFGYNLPNRAYTAIGESLNLGVDPAYRPLVVGVVLWMLIGLVVGIVAAFRMTSSRFATIAGLVVFGFLFGAFTSITFEPQVAAGIGIAVAYVAWIALMALDVSRTGIDIEALKARFTPTQTIETSKETLEWLQKRMPPGIGS